MPLAVATPDQSGAIQLNWIHGDHLGTPLIATDSTGALATTPDDYLAAAFPGQSRMFADLYYNRYRDYDPTTGRYIQADPIGLGGGANSYLYAGANPINAIDPTGEVANFVLGAAAGAAAEAITNPCATVNDLLLAAAIGSVTGGIGGKLGGKLLTGGLRQLSNRTKGRIGEALSFAKHTLRGSRRIRGGRLPDPYTSRPDHVFRPLRGPDYYVESKFGTSSLTKPQQIARDGLGNAYKVERWGYDFFDDWGSRAGAAGAGALGAAYSDDCGC